MTETTERPVLLIERDVGESNRQFFSTLDAFDIDFILIGKPDSRFFDDDNEGLVKSRVRHFKFVPDLNRRDDVNYQIVKLVNGDGHTVVSILPMNEDNPLRPNAFGILQIPRKEAQEALNYLRRELTWVNAYLNDNLYQWTLLIGGNTYGAFGLIGKDEAYRSFMNFRGSLANRYSDVVGEYPDLLINDEGCDITVSIRDQYAQGQAEIEEVKKHFKLERNRGRGR